MRLSILIGMVTIAALPAGNGEESKPGTSAPPEKPAVNDSAAVSPEMEAALEKLKLPKVKINLEKWAVDVEANVCEDYGLLEVVACVKGTRDHESVVSTEAKPSHIHTALLLLGGVPGSPAMYQMLEEDPPRYRTILPSGSPVDVYLVVDDEEGNPAERPITDFIIRGEEDEFDSNPLPPTRKKKAREHFPTKTFLFAGSVFLPAEGDAPRRYLADTEGNIVSISTFGDELLCLPDIHEKANESLVWQADSELLQPGEVILRLRPHRPNKTDKPAQPDKPAQADKSDK